MSKTEERLRNALNDILEKKEQRVEQVILDRSIGIFFWGFLIGALFSYISIIPFFIGLVIGIFVVKKNPFMVNVLIEKIFKIVNNGKNGLQEKISVNF